ncbi:two-component sensor histidine kinase [Paenibacillus marchantiophytorum]|uniref:histidine kinase n=1 Tax=Paenibacillus marchantiophytorum TaxID=1619310 RepID=A0ABQ2BRU1_9BACL|nr:HAMP domain-containing sensor histidine kinase [Paenibacillus marchantiophytorum]GGI44749.1 two-component sensor histidine kinase [Paenibacillus marchantiophytorum]
MKPLRIRQWMVIGMLIVLILPQLFYEIPGLFDKYVLENAKFSRQQEAINSLMREVGEADVIRWRNPDWQAEIEKKTAASDSGIVLLDASGREIYRSVPSRSESTAQRELSVMDQGQLRGKALFYAPKQRSELATAFALFAGVFAILFIGFQMARVVVKPLEAMGHAARRIASGDLEFQLPDSTVKEVADVRDAFQVMGTSLRESLIRQSELEAERRFFISSIAHDLRTPLFALRGFLTRLESGANPEKAARYTAICSKKAEQLERLVSDLFSYGQMSSLEQLLRLKPLDIGELFEDITADYLPLAWDKEIKLTYEAPAENIVIQGDAHLLRRAIGNLIDNALHYSPASSNLMIRLRREESRAHFTVEDTGPGIPEQQLPHIFDAFYRGDDSRNLEYGGSGLGLTIARRIVRAHYGDLVAENRSQGGSVFTGWIG